MSMAEAMNRQLYEERRTHPNFSFNFKFDDPGDYAECESCEALNMSDCIDCGIASYDRIQIKNET